MLLTEKDPVAGFRTGENENFRKTALRSAVIILLIFVAGIALIIYSVSQTRSEKEQEFRSISELKISQLSQWTVERLSEVNFFSGDKNIKAALHTASVYGKSDTSSFADIRSMFNPFIGRWRFSNIYLLDPVGKVVFAMKSDPSFPGPGLLKMLPEIVSGGDGKLIGFTYPDNEHVNFDLASPVYDTSGIAAGILWFRADAGQYIFPSLQNWPTSLKKSEILLIRKSASSDSIEYITPVNLSKNKKSRIAPVSGDEVSSAAFDGYTGMCRLSDYRKVMVYAYIGKFENEPWFTIVKTDRFEIFFNLLLQTVLFIVVLLLVGTLVYLLFSFSALRRESATNKALLQAQESLREKDISYRNMFENSPQPMWIYDLETLQFLDVNEAAIIHYGYSRDEFLSKTLRDIRPAEDIPALMKDVELTKKVYNPAGEWRHIKKNGEVINVEIISNSVYLGTRHARHVIVNDITEKKKVLEALRQSEEKYRTIFENVQDIFYQTRPDGTILEISPSVFQFSGYSREELIGNDVAMFYLDPADREQLLSVINVSGEIKDYPLAVKRKSGEILYVSVNARLVYTSEGQLSHIDGALRDITERTRAEKQAKLLDRAVQHSPANIVITNPEGSIEYVNPAFSALTGYTAEEVLGKNPSILKSGRHSPDFYKDLWDTIKSGNNWMGEIQNKTRDGKLYWENVFISPIHDNRGNISHFVAVKEDITEKKNLIENLIKAKEKAEESDRLKTAFLHNISHEIRTPLNAIIGFSAMLNQPDITQKERDDYAAIIYQSNTQLLSIINDILNISHIEAGQVVVKTGKVDVPRILKNLHSQFLTEASKKDLSFILEEVENLPSPESDESKIVQILTNLISNAIKFTKKGDIRLSCRVKGSFLLFAVSDTGLGIDASEQQKIFERFYQVDKELSRHVGGTGLGLAISKAYAEILGGEIWVDSEKGAGSTFYFSLPVVKEVLSARDKEVIRDSGRTVAGTRKSILVAEDENSNFILITVVLKRHNFNILRAFNGREAVEIFKNHNDIGLILMDIKMPEMNGYEATRLIREIDPSVPIIAQTAYAHPLDRIKALEAGCVGYIPKPFSSKQLVETVKKYLE